MLADAVIRLGKTEIRGNIAIYHVTRGFAAEYPARIDAKFHVPAGYAAPVLPNLQQRVVPG